MESEISSTHLSLSQPLMSVIVTKNYYQSENIPNTLQLMEDDIVYVINKQNNYWWDGLIIDPVGNISRGWFPVSYTKPYKNNGNSNGNSNGDNTSSAPKITSSKTISSAASSSPFSPNYAPTSTVSTPPAPLSTVKMSSQAQVQQPQQQLPLSPTHSPSNIVSLTPSTTAAASVADTASISSSMASQIVPSNRRQSLRTNYTHSNLNHSHTHTPGSNYHSVHSQANQHHTHNHSHHHKHVHSSKHKNSNNNIYHAHGTIMPHNHSQHHHINSKSSINHSEFSHNSPQQHQVSVSSLKSDQVSLPATSASLFKEKNYFVSKHDSFSSFQSAQASTNMQLSTHHQHHTDSRQSSQAHTEITSASVPSSVHLVTNEEVASYFQPSTNTDAQPSFNFVPVWLPQFTADNDVVYRNQALNVVTKDVPFIDADYINDKSLYESPDTLNLVSDLNQIPISLQRHNTLDSSIHMTSSTNNLKNITLQDSNFNNFNSNANRFLPNQQKPSQILHNLPNFANSRLTEIFYTDQADLLTWDALSSSFINSLDQCMSSLKKMDKPLFKNSMNDSSNALSLLHIAGRLIHQQLVDSNKMVQFSAILKKITNIFIQFRIWTTLIMASVDRMEDAKTKATTTLGLKTPENVTESKLNNYKDYSYRCRCKIEKLLTHLCLLSSSISIPGPNGFFQKNDSRILPMIYSRFVRDKYEGGNFNNKFANSRYNSSDFFVNLDNKSQINILLDDEAINKLKLTEHKISESMKEVETILAMKMPPDSTLQKFLDERNLTLLTAIYQLIPLLVLFINTIESIDLTVFAMIDKLAAKKFLPERQNTLITPDDSSYSRMDTRTARKATYQPQVEEDSIAFNTIEDEDDPLAEQKHRNDSTVSFSIDTKDEIHQSPGSESSTFYSDDTDNANQSFYDATAKTFRPIINDFIYLKQLLHSAFIDLILDSQTITTTDPETFFPIEKDRTMTTKGTSKTKQLTEILLKQLELLDSELSHGGIYTLEPSLKLLDTIKLSKERMGLIIVSIMQLKDERRSILNYCSRLMNTDFNIASLFVAERHNTLASITSQPAGIAGLTSLNTHQGFHGKSTSTMNSGTDPIDAMFYNGDDKDRYNNLDKLADNTSDEWNESENLPWYMGPDHDEENLIYETSTLKGGPARGLISKLVNPLNQRDQLFEFTFFCLFSTFTKPTTLFEILIEKYHIGMPDALSYEEYGIWLEQKLKPQQKNVLDVFETLFSKYWIIKYTSPELISIWNDFVEETPSISNSLVNLADKVFSFNDQEEYIDFFKLGNCEAKTIPMSSMTSAIMHLKLQSLSINYVADQITAVQAFYYRKLNLWDLLGRTYNFNKVLHKKNERNNDPLGTKNISNFIKNCNKLTHFTTYMILRRKDLNERVESIKFFISLAERLLALKNFSSMTAIISGLGSTSVSRLRKTWDEVPAAFNAKFQKMDNLMSIGKNYSEYRNILRFVETDDDAYLPFLGMYLSDLRFTTDGNSDWLGAKKGSKGLVNYSKRMNIIKIVKEVLDYNETLYKIKLDPDFSCYLHQMFIGLPDDEKMYELSIQIEPRVSLLKNSKNSNTSTSISSSVATGMAPNASVSSTSTTGVNNVFGGYSSTFGSVSTAASTQSGDSVITNTNASNTTASPGPKKDGRKLKPRYRS